MGIAIFVILSGIPPAMQGVFTASGIEPEDDSVTLFYRIVEIPGMVLKLHYSYDISKMINHLLIDVIVSVILNYHNKH